MGYDSSVFTYHTSLSHAQMAASGYETIEGGAPLGAPRWRKAAALGAVALTAFAGVSAYSKYGASSSSSTDAAAAPVLARTPEVATKVLAASVTATKKAATLGSSTGSAHKVVYGDMSADAVRSLFEKYVTEQSRTYSTDTEETYRFGIFKKNLIFIDKLNANNPTALFGVTRAADRTEEELKSRRMQARVVARGLRVILLRARFPYVLGEGGKGGGE